MFQSLHGIIIPTTYKCVQICLHVSLYNYMFCLDFCITQRFTSEEQGFPLCYSPTHSGPDGCQHVDMMEIILYPMLLYIVWQLLYIVWQLLYVVWQLLYIVWQLLYIVWQLLYIGVVRLHSRSCR